MQHYVIKFVSDLRQVGGFSGYSGFLRHDITEILLKVALNTINLKPQILCNIIYLLLYINRGMESWC
jgi:hypothetical protein